MKERIISSIIGAAVFLPIVYVGGHWFTWFVFILGVVGLYEMAKMRGIRMSNEIGLISVIAIGSVIVPERYFNNFLPITQASYIFYTCAMLLLVLTVYRHETFNFVDAATLLFASAYIGLGLRFLIEIRDEGLATFIYLLMVVWLTDIGAYFTGKTYGKTKLAPEISPNKTIEGSIGGVVIALMATTIYSQVIDLNLEFTNYLWIVTVFVSLAGQFGDLVESAYKRYFGVKDSGKFLPGHGGVLDRIDSTLFASTMFMLWFNLFN